ncbi:MAG: DDE-type integrase/transposase/recombinase [Actinomycetota bacterium]|nr:DDE-type integrase/transposase/recombinase [Actinomycetota bacterium]MDQ3456316.1 DDE-type integrase/transposase/recombinase [Actinomycetota bacterium]
MHDRHRDVALFRYSLIREAADPALSSAERGRLVRALAARDHTGPGGERVRVARNTLDRWVRAWRHGGFEALVPAARHAEATTPAAMLDLAVKLKREAPGRTAAQVAAIIAAAEGWSPSERTIQRLFARVGLNTRPDGTAPVAFGRFEAAAPNDRWTGDALHGPPVAGHKAYLFAFIDDHSRAITGYRWGHSEDTVRLEAALRHGLGSRGVPRSVYVDNGSAFVAAPLLRACAVLGIRLVHSRPGRPEGRGKIERFFRTVRDQFLIEVDAHPVADLIEMNRLFAAWVETAYHRRVHSETKATPLERFVAGGPFRIPTPDELHEAFLWSEQRTVTKTATVSLHANTFEVDAALVGRRVECVFDPFDLTTIEVRYQGRAMGVGAARVIGRHTHPMARPEAQPPPAATGIDYLGLLAERHAAELTELSPPIDYSGLIESSDPDQCPGQLMIADPESDTP